MTTQLSNYNHTDVQALIADGQQGLANAIKVAESLPAITDTETDEKAKALIEKLKLTVARRKEKRMPYTRMLDDIKKQFTEIENGLSTIADGIQSKRNVFAAQQVAKKREAEAAAAKELAIKQEEIAIHGDTVAHINRVLSKLLESVINHTKQMVDTVTEGNIQEYTKRLESVPKWTDSCDVIYNTPYTPPTTHIAKDVAAQAAKKILDLNKNGLIQSYIAQASQIMTDTIPLLKAALTNKEDAKRLQQAQEDEVKRIAAEAEINAAKEAETQSALAVLDQEKPQEVKATIDASIEILSNDGWLQIIAFWYENDPTSKVGDLTKKTFLQCKTFCEKHAKNTGEVISHPSIVYNEKIKAK